jgi:anthranilate 1,2-dioxygenase large subunit
MNPPTTSITREGSKIHGSARSAHVIGRVPARGRLSRLIRSSETYALEQERIYRGPTWNFLGLEAEITQPGDYKSTFVGDTPVVVTRAEDGTLAAWVNRCAHRGAIVCPGRRSSQRPNCVYHQWNYGTRGNLQAFPAG